MVGIDSVGGCLDVGVHVRIIPGGGGDLLDMESCIVSGYHEAAVFAIVLYLENSIVGLPRRVEFLGDHFVEVQLDSGLFKGGAVPAAPETCLLGFLLQSAQIVLEAFEGGVASGFDFGNELLLRFYAFQQGGSTFIHWFGGTGDIYQADFLEGREEIFLGCIQQHEGILCHFLYHRLSSSSSAAWRVLTILDEALLRFSSSSIYRLILRIAS